MSGKHTLFLLLMMIFVPSPAQAVSLQLKFMPPQAQIKLIQGKVTNRLKNPWYGKKKNGDYTILVESKDYHTRTFQVSAADKKIVLEDKLEKRYHGLELLRVTKVSGQPKSVVWLDNQRFVVNLLSGQGLELFEFTNHIGVISPTNLGKYKGFVEGYADHTYKRYVQSQMTTDSFHIYDLDTLKYRETHKTKGIWTKVITATSRYYFFSNWVSEDITIFDRKTLTYIKTIKMADIPRGMAATHDEKYLYVAIFGDALIQKIDMKTLKIIKNIRLSPKKGAARHIVLDRKKKLLYISDMGQAKIHKFDYSKDKILSSTKVFSKPNTIVLSPDGHRLFVSCRGPNGPKGYLEKGLVHGQLRVIDTQTMKEEAWIWGYNQTTGLDISPDGRYLVLGDFFDNKIEIYRVKAGLIRKSYK